MDTKVNKSGLFTNQLYYTYNQHSIPTQPTNKPHNIPHNKFHALFGSTQTNNPNLVIPIKQFNRDKNYINQSKKIKVNQGIINQLYKTHNNNNNRKIVTSNKEQVQKRIPDNLETKTKTKTELQNVISNFAKSNNNGILTINFFEINNDTESSNNGFHKEPIKNEPINNVTESSNKVLHVEQIIDNYKESNEIFNNFVRSIHEIEKKILLKNEIISEINDIVFSYENGDDNSSIKRFSREQSFDSDSISFIIGEEEVLDIDLNNLNYANIYENKEDFSLSDEDILNLD